MIARRGEPRRFLYIASFVGLLLSIVPLPRFLELLRPDCLLLVVIWFALMAPRSGGLFFAWCAGLALDAFQGVVLGQHALAFVLIAYLVHRFHLRMRMFPLSRQVLGVSMLLLLYQFVLFWIDGVTGHPVASLARWLAVATGALAWPVVSGFLGRYLQRT
jgi:rod shape-determining protein MreD